MFVEAQNTNHSIRVFSFILMQNKVMVVSSPYWWPNAQCSLCMWMWEKLNGWWNEEYQSLMWGQTVMQSCDKLSISLLSVKKYLSLRCLHYLRFGFHQFPFSPHAEHFKMATRCIAPQNGVCRAPSSAVFGWHASANTHGPPILLANPYPQLISWDPRILMLLFPNSLHLPWEQPGEEQLRLHSHWPWLIPSLHATQPSSCWQPPSASPPALMTFINELHSFWILMKSGDSDGERTCVGYRE